MLVAASGQNDGVVALRQPIEKVLEAQRILDENGIRVSIEGTGFFKIPLPPETTEGQKILDETRTISFYPMGPTASLLVLDIDLLASVCPITFGDTKEGSMGVRVRESLRVDKGKGTLTNAEGKTGEKGCWGMLSAWCDYSGPVGEDKIAGIAVFADPNNSIDTAWHARNYGLLAANPFGRDKHARFPARKGNNELVKLKKGEHLKLRYGIFVGMGGAIALLLGGLRLRRDEMRAGRRKPPND